MADNKSREGKRYKCLKCGWQDVISPSNPRTDGRVCSKCGGYSSFRGFVGWDFASGDDQTVLNIDCYDALKGLKAIQREAREATAALRELEEQHKRIQAKAKDILNYTKSYETRTWVGEEPKKASGWLQSRWEDD